MSGIVYIKSPNFSFCKSISRSSFLLMVVVNLGKKPMASCVKMKFYKSFRRTRLCLKLIKVDGLAKTDSLLPALLHKEDKHLLKFWFLSIFKPNNICLLLSEIFFIPYKSPKLFILYSERSKWQDLGLLLCYFPFIQWPESYHVLTFC